jgi:hypothetical protein
VGGSTLQVSHHQCGKCILQQQQQVVDFRHIGARSGDQC